MAHYNEHGNNNGTGRLANRPAPAEETAEDSYNPLLANSTDPLPAEEAQPVDLTGDPAPKEEQPAPKKEPTAGKKKKERGHNIAPKAPKKKPDPDDLPGDREKFSIYLDKELAVSLRMAYIITRKKFSHLAEEALSDMFYNRYQCRDCMTTFSISSRFGPGTVPTFCPHCGKGHVSQLLIDRLD